jgi:hypothetical protein
MIILSVFSAVYLYQKKQEKHLALSLFSSLIIFLIIGFLGSRIGLGTLQPGRFLMPAAILMSLIIAKVFKDLIREKNTLYLTMIIALFISSICAPQSFGYGYNACSPRGEAKRLLDFIRNNIKNSGRILVQDSEKRDPYFGCHFPGIIPHATSKEMAGGPGWVLYKDFKFVSFIDDTVFGRKPLKKISDYRLKQYLELYNIRYILTYSNIAHEFFGKSNMFKHIFKAGAYNIYEYLESKGSYCYEGTADIRVDYDKIFVENASPGTIILKYHYIDTLRIRPDWLKIGPVRLMDDPIPFIKVENGTCTNFTIYNAGLREDMI